MLTWRFIFRLRRPRRPPAACGRLRRLRRPLRVRLRSSAAPLTASRLRRNALRRFAARATSPAASRPAAQLRRAAHRVAAPPERPRPLRVLERLRAPAHRVSRYASPAVPRRHGRADGPRRPRFLRSPRACSARHPALQSRGPCRASPISAARPSAGPLGASRRPTGAGASPRPRAGASRLRRAAPSRGR